MFYIYHAFMEKPYKDTKNIGVIFPDFLGLVSTGNNYEEAKDNMKQALRSHIEVMIKNGHEIPEPTNLNTIMEDKNMLEKINNNKLCIASVGVYIKIEVT